jgi:hypothetical protein
MVAADTLEETRFAVVEAENADAALKLLETRVDVCLLFTDIQMPGSCDGDGPGATGSRPVAQQADPYGGEVTAGGRTSWCQKRIRRSKQSNGWSRAGQLSRAQTRCSERTAPPGRGSRDC